MRREMLEALNALAIGNIKKAKMNIEIRKVRKYFIRFDI